MVEAYLFIILLAVLIGPFIFRRIEHNLEIFLFAMGLFSIVVSREYIFTELTPAGLLKETLLEPLKIAVTVLLAGLLFKYSRAYIRKGLSGLLGLVSLKVFIFLMIVLLGLISSLITAIIASLVLVEIISVLKLDRRYEVNMTVLACFSIGFGAALTPVGEPLSTILIAKLRAAPHSAGFFYIIHLAGWYIVAGVILFGLIGLFYRGHRSAVTLSAEEQDEALSGVFFRAGRVYIFVMALILLGTGFRPVIDRYVASLDSRYLFWINSVSAILDNATLTAAEITPGMTNLQVLGTLMGLLIAGGMLIPGNIPNIISAGRLKITSREWARSGVPLGLAVMVLYFIIIYFLFK